jgi:hypothetical protein
VWGWCRRHPLPVLIVAVVVVALVGGLVWWQSRPTAWLDLQVSTPKATATLDGEPLALENGSARVRRRAGRYKLVVRAPDYLDHVDDVRLVRGEANAAVVRVELVSRFGTARVTSAPAGAWATVRDGDGRLHDKVKKTPAEFRLKAGNYVLFVDQDLYERAQQRFTVEAGGKVVVVPTVTLKFNATASEGQPLFDLMDRLGKPRAEAFDAVPGGQPIMEYLNRIGTETKVRIVLDPISLPKAGLDSGTMTVGHIWPLANVSPLRVLEIALSGHKLTVVPRQERKAEPELLVVTLDGARLKPYRIVHNVRDLVAGKGALSPEALVEAARKGVGQPGDWAERPVEPKKDEPAPATLKFLKDGPALEVRGPWVIQSGVRENLRKLREARAKAG